MLTSNVFAGETAFPAVTDSTTTSGIFPSTANKIGSDNLTGDRFCDYICHCCCTQFPCVEVSILFIVFLYLGAMYTALLACLLACSVFSVCSILFLINLALLCQSLADIVVQSALQIPVESR